MAEVTDIVAVLNKQPMGESAWVTAKVTVPNIAAQAKLVKRVPQGINPQILMLVVEVSSPGGATGSALAVRDVRFDERPPAEDYTSVDIDHGGDSFTADLEVVH